MFVNLMLFVNKYHLCGYGVLFTSYDLFLYLMLIFLLDLLNNYQFI